jgi:hypothetical protein
MILTAIDAINILSMGCGQGCLDLLEMCLQTYGIFLRILLMSNAFYS